MDEYATLPRKTARRWSMVTGQTGERERMEGCPLTVCTHCKEMVLQVKVLLKLNLKAISKNTQIFPLSLLCR